MKVVLVLVLIVSCVCANEVHVKRESYVDFVFEAWGEYLQPRDDSRFDKFWYFDSRSYGGFTPPTSDSIVFTSTSYTCNIGEPLGIQFEVIMDDHTPEDQQHTIFGRIMHNGRVTYKYQMASNSSFASDKQWDVIIQAANLVHDAKISCISTAWTCAIKTENGPDYMYVVMHEPGSPTFLSQVKSDNKVLVPRGRKSRDFKNDTSLLEAILAIDTDLGVEKEYARILSSLAECRSFPDKELSDSEVPDYRFHGDTFANKLCRSLLKK
jgi:hypothetical protein